MSIPTTSPASDRVFAPEPTHFYLALDVEDMPRSLAFFTALLGVEPQEPAAGQVVFELDDPPLVVSLTASSSATGVAAGRFGFRLPTAAALGEVRRRLAQAGMAWENSREDRILLRDPDGRRWEITAARGAENSDPSSNAAESPALAIWSHRLEQPFPARLPILDATVDQVVLERTFNERLAPDEIKRRLTELRRILKPGGRVRLDLLTADRPLHDAPLALPGAAAAVQTAPVAADLVAQFQAAGFRDARLTFVAPAPDFRVAGAELRETRLEGTKK